VTDRQPPVGAFRAVDGFPATYGPGVSAGLLDRLEAPVVVTQPEPWELFGARLGGPPLAVAMADDLSPGALDALADSLPPCATVVGVGGGTAMDVAKWVHGRRGLALHQVPTLPSVDACFTRMTALRVDGLVRYAGDAVPDVVYVDDDILCTTPSHLLSAGIGDVLSCHSALFDWRYAVARGHDPAWDDEAAGSALRLVDGLESAAAALRAREPSGVHSLMEMHREIGWRCHELQHARFEEGSEHFFAYCFEETTGRTILHGELVTLGVLLTAALFDNSPLVPRRIAQRAGTRHTLDALDVEWAEVEATVRRLSAFVRDGGYWYSPLHELVVTDDVLAAAHEALQPAGG